MDKGSIGSHLNQQQKGTKNSYEEVVIYSSSIFCVYYKYE